MIRAGSDSARAVDPALRKACFGTLRTGLNAMSQILTTQLTVSNWIHFLMASMSDLTTPIEEDENEAYFEMDPGIIDDEDEEEDEYGLSEDDNAYEDDEDDLG